MPKKLSIEDFIEKAKKIHGDKDNYYKVKYVNSKTKICLICQEHGEYWMIPNSYLQGCRCPQCKNDKLHSCFAKTTEDFIIDAQKVHGNKYDYSKVNYINNETSICIICPEHGEFWQKPSNHLSGKGCFKCKYDKQKLTTQSFIEKANTIHNNRYTYNNTVYKGSKEKLLITCQTHGDFLQTPNCHLMGCGCPKCCQSHLENQIECLLEKNSINYIVQQTFDWLKYKIPLKLDFYLPDYNIAIECQGEQHFISVKHFGGEKEFLEIQIRDKIKQKLCNQHNIKILYYTIPKYYKNKIDDEIILDEKTLIQKIREAIE